MPTYSAASSQLEGQKMFQILAQCKELEKNGRDIVHFEIGDPDFSTPPNVTERAIRALRAGETHYVSSSGLESFRAVAAERTKKSRGFTPDLNQILVTPGANVQIYYSLACVANPGDEVITVDPCFVSYRSIFKFLGLAGRFVTLHEENNFRLRPKDIESFITAKTKAILINSPHNPTGAVLSPKEMREIYEIADKHDLWLISDEVYGRITYTDGNTEFASPASFDKCRKRTVLIHSLSKSYAMTGWRIGAVTAPAELVKRMGLLLETTSSCVSPFVQLAAEEALTAGQGYIDEMVSTFRSRRDLVQTMIESMPLVRAILPAGAFYTFVNVKETGMDDVVFSDRLLSEFGVATCPGSFFGEAGRGYVRICFAVSEERIEEGMKRMMAFLQQVEREKPYEAN